MVQLITAHRAAADFQDTPNIKFADHTSDVIFCATPTPRRMGGEKLFSPNVSASKVKRFVFAAVIFAGNKPISFFMTEHLLANQDASHLRATRAAFDRVFADFFEDSVAARIPM